MAKLKLNKVTELWELNVGDNYLIFVGNDFSPSGFDIASFDIFDIFQLSNGDHLNWEDGMLVFELPDKDDLEMVNDDEEVSND